MIDMASIKKMRDYDKSLLIAMYTYGKENTYLDYHPFMGEYIGVKVSGKARNFFPYTNSFDSQDLQIRYINQIAVTTDCDSININVFDIYNMEVCSSDISVETLRRELADCIVMFILNTNDCADILSTFIRR